MQMPMTNEGNEFEFGVRAKQQFILTDSNRAVTFLSSTLRFPTQFF
jgi:hypothetical protein